MPALRLRNVVTTLLKLTGGSQRAKSLTLGPGCTCESCVQAWGRQQEIEQARHDPPRRLRPGLY